MRTQHSNPALYKVINGPEDLSDDEIARLPTEMREKARLNKQILLGAAREKGLQKD